MNNPFDRTGGPAGMPGMAGINNPFDSDPSNARNRFPDISAGQGQYAQFDPSAAGGYNQWSQPQQQAQQQYGQFGTPGQGVNPSSMYSGFGSTPQSPFGAPAGMGMNPQNYTPMGSSQFSAGTPMSPYGTPGFGAGSYAGSSAGGGYMDAQRYGTGVNVPQNTSANPLLSHFDPLSSSSGGSYQSMLPGQQRQAQSQSSFGAGAHGVGPMGMGMGVGVNVNQGSNFQLNLGQPTMDAGTLIWHPRNPADPNTQTVTGFANTQNQTTIHVPIRASMFSQYTARDHPKSVIAQHRAELEQWDQFGWRQSLNSFENLRIAWETVLTDVTRVADAGFPAHENAIVLKMKKEVSEKIDSVTAAYLQMQEVYSSYRQSQDMSSRNRVRECLNAGLKNLPDWP